MRSISAAARVAEMGARYCTCTRAYPHPTHRSPPRRAHPHPDPSRLFSPQVRSTCDGGSGPAAAALCRAAAASSRTAPALLLARGCRALSRTEGTAATPVYMGGLILLCLDVVCLLWAAHRSFVDTVLEARAGAAVAEAGAEEVEMLLREFGGAGEERQGEGEAAVHDDGEGVAGAGIGNRAAPEQRDGEEGVDAPDEAAQGRGPVAAERPEGRE